MNGEYGNSENKIQVVLLISVSTMWQDGDFSIPGNNEPLSASQCETNEEKRKINTVVNILMNFFVVVVFPKDLAQDSQPAGFCRKSFLCLVKFLPHHP